MASNKVNPLEDWESEELSEAELDLLAGGTDPFAKDPLPLFQGDSPLLVGDVQLRANVDSSYSSHLGATGANKNELSAHLISKPLNITNRFP